MNKCLIWLLAILFGSVSPGLPAGAAAEWNPLPAHGAQSAAQADRLIIGFRATAANGIDRLVPAHAHAPLRLRVAQTSPGDALAAAARNRVAVKDSRQITPAMHVLFLAGTLYGADVEQALGRLRADPAVAYAAVDARRYADLVPDDPLFGPSQDSSAGQWYLDTPSTLTPSSDAAATDVVSAWDITTGAAGVVIADVDSGIRFDHPDLLRAGFGGRLLPGYDFVGQDYSAANGTALGTYAIANDGDGWDADPSDPGDWINAADQMNTAVFPVKNCMVADSTWHGTRVMGVLGALTNDAVGVAGITWNSYLLPVRALGKCGGYDSDIIAAIDWAVGLPVAGVTDNPYPAEIVNLSIGGSGTCSSAYESALATLNTLGVLVVVSAGNASGPVGSPANCPGVLAVAGLRNIGTKVGYSSFGPEVSIAAPAGNCVNASGACIRSIDTTYNTGLTTPADDAYTNDIIPNLGTSFSAPIVSGIAALMRSVNANLTPSQLIARLQGSANPFPAPSGLPQCPNSDPGTLECACVPGQCGAGMVDALGAVKAALRPIATVTLPANPVPGAVTFDASPSVAACNALIASYAWTASGGVGIVGPANTAKVDATWSGAGGTLTLLVTDGAGATDTAVIQFSAAGVSSAAPQSGGSSATACPQTVTFAPVAPQVTEAFAPASIAAGAVSTLTYTFANANDYALTQAGFTQTVPAALSITTPAAGSTCGGAAHALTVNGATISLTDFTIPARGSCSLSIAVKSMAAGSYADAAAAGVLTTGPAGANTTGSSATLSVTAPRGGGGDFDWLDIMLVVGVLLVCRRRGNGASRS
jgi:serine protease